MQEACEYRVAVKGIAIDNEGKILLAQEDNGRWEMLGGGLEHNEDPMVCLRREITEETGLQVTNISNQPLYFITASKAFRSGYVANIIYQIELENLDFTPSAECQALRYLSVDEMKQVKLFPNVQKLLEVIETDPITNHGR
jgi:8-oxo-dGTP pyrophosphatase MutT (NUDIX family)